MEKTLMLTKRMFFLLTMFFAVSSAYSQADLMIHPKRIVFDDVRERVAVVELFNKGKDTTVYNLSFVQVRMKEDGSFENISDPDPGQNFASPYLRYYPRKVELAPNEVQTVKIQLVKTNDLLPGEYRSHLNFRGVPEDIISNNEGTDEDEGDFKINLIPIYGIAIPVIIKVGESSTQVTIENLELQETKTLNFNLKRQGDISVFGNIEVIFTPFGGGLETVVGKINGIAVYQPTRLRNISLILNNFESKPGTLNVKYVIPGSKEIIAENYLSLE